MPRLVVLCCTLPLLPLSWGQLDCLLPDEKETVLSWANATVAYSNIGGSMTVTGGSSQNGSVVEAGASATGDLANCPAGPPYTVQSGCTPQALRFNSVGIGACMGDGCVQQPFDLIITNQSEYVAHLSKWNKVNKGYFGQVNVKGPSAQGDPSTVLDVKFCFVEAGTDTPFTVNRLPLSFFDFDADFNHPSRGIEELTMKTSYVAATVSTNTELTMKPANCVLHANPSASETHCTTFRATQGGKGADNPADPLALTDVQKNRAVEFTFANVSCIDIEFKVEPYIDLSLIHI